MSRIVHEPLGITGAEAVLRGEQFGREHGIYDRTDISHPEDIISRLGGTINTREPNASDLLRIYDRDDFTVLLPRNTSIKFDRLACAEAVGHYAMHYLPKADVRPQALFRYTESAPLFREAHFFALGLLLPQAVILDRFEENPSPAKVGFSMQVGLTATEERLRLMSQRTTA